MVDESDGTARARPSDELAVWLRDLRRASGRSLGELAARTGYSRTVLGDACSGRRIVTLPVLDALVEACGGDREAWAGYWRHMRRLVDEGDKERPRSELRPPWAAPDDVAPGDPAAPDADDEPESGAVLAGGRRTAAVRGALAAATALVVLGAGWTAHAVHGRSGQPAVSPRATAAVPAARVETSPAPTREQQFNRNGGPTFKDPFGVAEPGPRIPFKTFVDVTCKVYAPSIESVKPDGYWYRIATGPWDDDYYAAANTFLNGDPEDGPYTHNTDLSVPDC